MEIGKNRMWGIALIMPLALLTGCGKPECEAAAMKQSATGIAPVTMELSLEEPVEETELFVSEPYTEEEKEDIYIVPILPASGQKLADFIPEDWELIDNVELDFNEDGITDYVAVLQRIPSEEEETWRYPRILFAIASEGQQYRLDFQDKNLIRTSEEGGVFGDPYVPMEAEGASFTTHNYGGSAWRWEESYTYTYREGDWYLTASEDIYGYGSYITDYSQNDWESGTGIRKKRSSEFDEMEKYWDRGDSDYDIVYEVTLDAAPTLYQASMRWWLAPERMTDWEVKDIEVADGITLSKDLIKLPQQNMWVDDCDEEGILYTFEAEGKYYLAMYRWENQILSVLAQSGSEFDDIKRYENKIYYAAEIRENITYKTMQDGKETIIEQEETIGMNLNRINLDGSGKEIIFEYLYPEAGQEIKNSRPPYLALSIEINGQEIVAEVYNGDGVHPFYRMNLDGSGLQMIGQTPRGS